MVLTEDMNKIKHILEGTENEKQGLTESLSTSVQQCEDLRSKLEEAEKERIRAIEEIRKQLSDEFSIQISHLEEALARAKVC